MVDFLNTISGYIWGMPLVILAVFTGVLFTLQTRCLQVRRLRSMTSALFENDKTTTGISSFQALAVSIATRVGTGNVAGVATAIAIGGPGSVFWMWLIAFFGAATGFYEATLAQIYKEKVGDEYRGGSSFYIEKGLGSKLFASIFAISFVLAFSLATPGIQTSELASSMQNAFGIPALATGIIMAVLVGVVVFGGVKRIARVAEIIVPFMAILYVLLALYIIGKNISLVPEVFSLIFSSAFGANATFGGIIGSAIILGVKRGIYSNESGQGTTTPFAGAAEVTHPVKQGFVQAFSVYIDTLIVCSATAFIILISGLYNVSDGEGGYLKNALGEVNAGSTFTQYAVDSAIPGFGFEIVAIVLVFFVFTTLIGNYYAGEVHAGYLEEKTKQKWIIQVYRLIVLATIVTSTLYKATTAWTLGDIGLGIMSWINFIALLLLSRIVYKTLKDYELQLKEGKEPVFNPQALGIKNASFWEERLK